MWNLTKKAKATFQKCNLLPIHESDEEWEIVLREAAEEGENIEARLIEELREVKDELLEILPERFLPYVENETLNQPTLPKEVRNDYLQWMRDRDQEFEHVLDWAYEQTERAVADLPVVVQEVFAESLHDSIIERIERKGDTLHLYINTDGGFSTKAHIHLIFQDVVSEESDGPLHVGQWIVYNELQKTDDGFAFRVLFDCPDVEWTIEMKGMDAKYYYRPKTYVTLWDEGKLKEITLAEFVSLLNRDYRYWFITPHATCEIRGFSKLPQIENGTIESNEKETTVTIGNKRYSYQTEEFHPANFIYTDVYEDPYAQFKEPVPEDELEESALSDHLELQVRAWNTLYSSPKEHTQIIHRVLTDVEITDENEMMLYVYVKHFSQAGILTEELMEKFRSILDEEEHA